jgi:PAS domain-containing protein
MTKDIIPSPPLGMFSLKTDKDGEIKEIVEHHALWSILGQPNVGQANQIPFFSSILRQSNRKSVAAFMVELRSKHHDTVSGYFTFGLDQRFLKFEFAAGQAIGALHQVFGTVTDLTDIGLVARHYQDVLDASQAYTWYLDLSKKEAAFGPSFVQHAKYGPDNMNISIEDWSKALHPDDLAKASKALEDLRSGKKRQLVVEYRRRDKSDDWITLRVHAGVSRYGFDGQPVEIKGISFNITP